jgi:Superinfection immunity protein
LSGLGALFTLIVLLGFGAMAYFVPTIVAALRRAPDLGLVVLINTLAGWTAAGWVFALFLAMRTPPPPPVPLPQPIDATPPSPSNDLYLTAALTPVDAPGVVKRPNEVFYCVVPRTDLLGEKQTTDLIGHAGANAVAVSGVGLESGRFDIQEAHRLAIDVDDSGMFALSNLRILFLGNRLTIDVPFADVAAVATFKDGLRVNRANAASLIFRTGSPREAGVLQRLMCGDLGPHLAVQPNAAVQPNPGARPGP